MNKKAKINEEIIEKTQSLMLDMSNKVYDIWKQHEYNFLTLVWFLIATAAVIVTSDSVLENVKSILIISIILLSIWLFLSNNLTWAQIIKYLKVISYLSKTSESLNSSEIISAQNEANKQMNIKILDVVFTIISSLFLNTWFVLFIIWLIKYLKC